MIKSLKITVFLKKDINLEEMYKHLSNYVNGIMKNNETLSKIHKTDRKFKFYCFSGLLPITNDKVYKKDNLYHFYLKSPAKNIIEEFKIAFKEYIDDTFINCSIIEQNFDQSAPIKELITLTPCTITYNGRSLKEKRMSLIRERVITNLIRKYNEFYNESVSEDFDFLEDINMHNRVPLRIRYKTTSILGFKLRMEIKQDNLSQSLALFALQTGLLEKNSLGLGYCMAVKGD